MLTLINVLPTHKQNVFINQTELPCCGTTLGCVAASNTTIDLLLSLVTLLCLVPRVHLSHKYWFSFEEFQPGFYKMRFSACKITIDAFIIQSRVFVECISFFGMTT